MQSILYCLSRHRPFFDQFFSKSNRFLAQCQQRDVHNRLQMLFCCVFITRTRFLDDQLRDEQVKILTKIYFTNTVHQIFDAIPVGSTQNQIGSSITIYISDGQAIPQRVTKFSIASIYTFNSRICLDWDLDCA